MLLVDLMSGQNWNLDAVTLHALDHRLDPVQNLLLKKWDFTVVLRGNQMPVPAPAARNKGNFLLIEKAPNIQGKNCRKKKELRRWERLTRQRRVLTSPLILSFPEP